MKTLCIVTCGKTKIWDKNPNAGPTKARYTYIGPFAKKCMEYAERFYPSSWCILSAKYGFLYPDDIIPKNYNVRFSDKMTKPITTEELTAQVTEKGLEKYLKIVALGGKCYAEVVRKIFPTTEIFTPLSDCRGNGYMMSKLNNAIGRGVPL